MTAATTTTPTTAMTTIHKIESNKWLCCKLFPVFMRRLIAFLPVRRPINITRWIYSFVCSKIKQITRNNSKCLPLFVSV